MLCTLLKLLYVFEKQNYDFETEAYAFASSINNQTKTGIQKIDTEK